MKMKELETSGKQVSKKWYSQKLGFKALTGPIAEEMELMKWTLRLMLRIKIYHSQIFAFIITVTS